MATLVIVDDEPEISEQVKEFFEEEGHTVYTADTGEEGVRLVEELKPDLLLVDLKLPGISGLQVLETTKKISTKTKTLVITGYVDQTLIDEAERLGRDAFLHKPFNFETLKQEVDRLLA